MPHCWKSHVSAQFHVKTSSGGKTMRCGKSSSGQWFTIRGESVPLRYLYNNPRGNIPNTNISSCKRHCEEFDMCSVAMVTTACEWYEWSQTYSYYRAQPALEDGISIKLCPTGTCI